MDVTNLKSWTERQEKNDFEKTSKSGRSEWRVEGSGEEKISSKHGELFNTHVLSIKSFINKIDGYWKNIEKLPDGKERADLIVRGLTAVDWMLFIIMNTVAWNTRRPAMGLLGKVIKAMERASGEDFSV